VAAVPRLRLRRPPRANPNPHPRFHFAFIPAWPSSFTNTTKRGTDGQSRGHLFLWTVFILLLIGIAFACWLGSFYIFGHPEKPRPYKILKKLKKIEAPKRFEVTMAPLGEFLPAKKMFERYANMKTLELQQENDLLLRNFIKNYKETKKLLPYVAGRFQVVETAELKTSDVFTSGVVALAVSEENPQVLLELVFTTPPENVASCLANLQQGRVLRLEKSRDLAAIVHIERTPTGHLQFTAMPIAYGSWRTPGSAAIVSLEPPADLNLDAGFPIIRGGRLQTGLDNFADLVRKNPKPPGEDGDKPASNEPELVRVDTVKPGTPVPETGPITGPVVALDSKGRPIPTPTKLALNTTPTPVPVPVPTPVPRIAVATPMPVSTPLAVATPLWRGPPGSSPQPFFGSLNPGTAPATTTWKTFPPGSQPPGRVVTSGEAGEMAQRGQLNGRFYLRGTFVVTASAEGRAVLRAQGAPTEAAGARVMVEYPPNALAPAEGSTITRDDDRAFEVRDVRRGTNGQLNIWVREVTE